MTPSVSTLHYFINAKLTLINVEREDLSVVDLSDSEVEFLGSTQLSNSQIIQKNSPRSPTPPSPRTIIANQAPHFSSSPLSDLPDIDDPVVRERLSQSQAPLFSLSQNIPSTEIPSSDRVSTRKSRGVQRKSKAQLEWGSQQRADNAPKSVRISSADKKRVPKSKIQKTDVSQLINDFSELASPD